MNYFTSSRFYRFSDPKILVNPMSISLNFPRKIPFFDRGILQEKCYCYQISNRNRRIDSPFVKEYLQSKERLIYKLITTLFRRVLEKHQAIHSCSSTFKLVAHRHLRGYWMFQRMLIKKISFFSFYNTNTFR